MWKILKYGIAVIFLLALFTRVMNDPEITGNNSSTSVSQQLEQAQNKKSQETPKNYAEADINVLISDAKNNAAKANKDYTGKYVKIVNGRVSNIDSDADYVSLKGGDQFTLLNVQCYAKDQKTKDAIINLSTGQSVAIYGKITDVGEIMGYSVDIDRIE